METPLYDQLGTTYTATRREDPDLAGQIHAALGNSRTVLNVGAGAGAYEPRDRTVLAVEPSPVMIAQAACGRHSGGAGHSRAAALRGREL